MNTNEPLFAFIFEAKSNEDKLQKLLEYNQKKDLCDICACQEVTKSGLMRCCSKASHLCCQKDHKFA